MGCLHYGSEHTYEFKDRTLTHLRTVITRKLLQQESFLFTWVDEGRQVSIWLHPGVFLAFEFEESATAELNTAWLQLLLSYANSPSGLQLAPEPAK